MAEGLASMLQDIGVSIGLEVQGPFNHRCKGGDAGLGGDEAFRVALSSRLGTVLSHPATKIGPSGTTREPGW